MRQFFNNINQKIEILSNLKTLKTFYAFEKVTGFQRQYLWFSLFYHTLPIYSSPYFVLINFFKKLFILPKGLEVRVMVGLSFFNKSTLN